jgi:ribonuclease P protein component
VTRVIVDFSRKKRLVTKAEYDSVFNQAKKVNQTHLLALYKKNTIHSPRLGVIVSKKNAKHAVTRNQVKRIVRESFRVRQDQFSGIDIIVLARKSCSTLNKIELREAIDQLWDKLIACQ